MTLNQSNKQRYGRLSYPDYSQDISLNDDWDFECLLNFLHVNVKNKNNRSKHF